MIEWSETHYPAFETDDDAISTGAGTAANPGQILDGGLPFPQSKAEVEASHTLPAPSPPRTRSTSFRTRTRTAAGSARQSCEQSALQLVDVAAALPLRCRAVALLCVAHRFAAAAAAAAAAPARRQAKLEKVGGACEELLGIMRGGAYFQTALAAPFVWDYVPGEAVVGDGGEWWTHKN